MELKSDRHIPPPVDDIQVNACKKPLQVNVCKTPLCTNFAVHPRYDRVTRGDMDNYKVTMTTKRFGSIDRSLVCKECGVSTPIKSNQAVKEELDRISAYLENNDKIITCPTPGCKTRELKAPVTSSRFRRFGLTKSKTGRLKGSSQRYQCKTCKATITVPRKTTIRQRKPGVNEDLFEQLVTKSVLRLIAQRKRIWMPALYGKIRFFHAQCLAFAAAREAKLLTGEFNKPEIFLCTDRQDFLVNWKRLRRHKNEKKHPMIPRMPIQINAITTIDSDSGYVFGSHANYDEIPNHINVNAEAEEERKKGIPRARQTHARLWLDSDYAAAEERNRNKSTIGRAKRAIERAVLNLDPVTRIVLLERTDQYEKWRRMERLRDAIEAHYKNSDPEIDTTTIKLPVHGMQVHEEYTMMAHFLLMKRLLDKSAENICFYIDADTGMMPAFNTAFSDWIVDGRCNGFAVRISKTGLDFIKQRWQRHQYSKKVKARKANPTLSAREVELLLWKQEKEARQTGPYKYTGWLHHPSPGKNEPAKRVLYFTNRLRYNDDPDHLFRLYDRATRQPLDNYYQLLRRRDFVLERGLPTAAKDGKLNYVYQAYNPRIIQQILDIYRVYHNYVDPRREPDEPTNPRTYPKKRRQQRVTPAMKIGLANRSYSTAEILSFRPELRSRHSVDPKTLT